MKIEKTMHTRKLQTNETNEQAAIANKMKQQCILMISAKYSRQYFGRLNKPHRSTNFIESYIGFGRHNQKTKNSTATQIERRKKHTKIIVKRKMLKQHPYGGNENLSFFSLYLSVSGLYVFICLRLQNNQWWCASTLVSLSFILPAL